MNFRNKILARIKDINSRGIFNWAFKEETEGLNWVLKELEGEVLLSEIKEFCKKEGICNTKCPNFCGNYFLDSCEPRDWDIPAVRKALDNDNN